MNHALLGAAVLVVAACPAAADDAASLRLVPFPKKVEIHAGRFQLDRSITVTIPAKLETATTSLLLEEFRRANLEPPNVKAATSAETSVRLTSDGGTMAAPPELRSEAGEEDYALNVTEDGVVIVAPAMPGLRHGLATLTQLVRANRHDSTIPCLTIRDWPSIRWRAFQDDITRGPSTKLSELEKDVARGAFLKLNVFTYYMQHQFAFSKHPLIGPEDGSLTPEELAALVAFGRPLGVEIMGNQQSFAHMQHTLAHEEYAHLKEDDRTLSPVKEGTYELLDDLYSDVLPILPFELFNVCCDETWGLGTKGPSKTLADEIGPGGVYIRHILRVRDLVHGKYGKRMLMWGDVILNHPDKLDEIPKDVVMLTWGYSERDSYEHQIVPFVKGGYEFFVCPGVSNWSRVLPEFRRAALNIQQFVRDGAKHGMLGMLNTSWDDDGENLNAPNWYGFAWGAECAWNASTTGRDDFDRRIGPVLFGESGKDFGRAIELLSDRRFCGMTNWTFWHATTGLVKPAERASLEACLVPIREAIRFLDACRKDAVANAHLIDPLLFGARRMEHYYQSQIDRIDAALAYDRASKADGADASSHLKEAGAALGRTHDSFRRLRGRWQTLWNRENKPHALDWSLARYDQALARCERVAAELAAARRAAEAGKSLPDAAVLGLQLWARPEKLTVPGRIESSLGNYQDYYPEFSFDGNPETFYWSDRGLVAGDHFTLNFEQPVALESITILFGTDRYRQEFIHDGILESQGEDGTWTKLAELDAARVDAELPDAPIKALRLRVNAPQKYWLIVSEIQVQTRR